MSGGVSLTQNKITTIKLLERITNSDFSLGTVHVRTYTTNGPSKAKKICSDSYVQIKQCAAHPFIPLNLLIVNLSILNKP